MSVAEPAGDPRDEDRHREDDEAEDEHGLTPEDVAGTGAEKQEAAEDERVGVLHPGELGRGEAEVGLQVG